MIYYSQTANKQLERKQICQNDIFISYYLVQAFNIQCRHFKLFKPERKIDPNLPMACILNIQIYANYLDSKMSFLIKHDYIQ